MMYYHVVLNKPSSSLGSLKPVISTPVPTESLSFTNNFAEILDSMVPSLNGTGMIVSSVITGSRINQIEYLSVTSSYNGEYCSSYASSYKFSNYSA